MVCFGFFFATVEPNEGQKGKKYNIAKKKKREKKVHSNSFFSFFSTLIRLRMHGQTSDTSKPFLIAHSICPYCMHSTCREERHLKIT